MDWKQILSLSFDELTDLKRDELYEHLVALRRETLDKKHFKKLIDLMQHILKYKGDMVNTLLTELEVISSKDLQQIDTEVVLSENAQLKDIIAKLDGDKAKLKSRLTELTEENAYLQQRRPLDANAAAAGASPGAGGAASSDREDSPDVLSELDRHEELLGKIAQKNKHIKRLLRDIDTLEAQNGSQHKQTAELRDRLLEATGTLNAYDGQLAEHKRLLAERSTAAEALRLQVHNLEEQAAAVQAERAEREAEIQEFGRKLEERAIRWRAMLQDKDDRLDSLRTKYEHVLEQNPGASVDAATVELRRLTEAVGERDAVIVDLETKVSELSNEMMDTTELMHRLAREREGGGEFSDKYRGMKREQCAECTQTRQRLDGVLARSTELQDLLAAAEEDSGLKAQQALEALDALNAFKSGQDGLKQTLQKNANLQAQLVARDKQIREFIVQVNGTQHVSQENVVLRRRLGLPDDETVDTNSLAAKQRKSDKVNERLTLKLRASEEMRLQLKLDKNDLKRKLAQMQAGNNVIETITDTADDLRMCEQCLKQYKPSQVQCKTCAERKDRNCCSQCCDDSPKDEKAEQQTATASEWEELSARYSLVIDENENLRIGMHEILQQLRNYDAESDHIVIDTPTLEKLLHALDARSVSGWYHPAMRMQNELIAVKERELALKERVRATELQTNVNNVAEEPQCSDSNPNAMQTVEHSVPVPAPRQFDALLQRFLEQEALIVDNQTALERAIDAKRESDLANEQLRDIEQQFHDLTEMLANGDDEQMAAIGRQAEAVQALQSRCITAEKRRQYAEDDFHNWRSKQRSQSERQTAVLYELRKELIAKKQKAKDLVVAKQEKPPAGIVADERNSELAYLKMKLSKFSGKALQEYCKLETDPQLKIDFEKINQLGVINAECVVELISRSEINTLKNENKWLHDRNAELEKTNQHLADVLKLSQNQLCSQQKVLNEQSEDEITLRHLIVDLQSDSQEKYIIAKMTKDLKKAHENAEQGKRENVRLQNEMEGLQHQLTEQTEKIQRIEEEHQAKEANCALKLRFICKSFADMRENFQQFTPLYPLVEFVQHYSMVLDARRSLEKSAEAAQSENNEEMIQKMCNSVRESLAEGNRNQMEDKIDIIKHEAQNLYLKQQLQLAQAQIDELHAELKTIKLRAADWSQQWDTIKLLFGSQNPIKSSSAATQSTECTPTVQVVHKETQSTVCQTNDQSVNTDNTQIAEADNEVPSIASDSSSSDHATFTVDATEAPVPQAAPRHKRPSIAQISGDTQYGAPLDISLASQLKQAMALASARSSLLLDAEHQLTTAQTRIKALERSLQERDKALHELRNNAANSATGSPRCDENILSVTIASLQGLLLEKDTTMARYQDLLRGERENRTAAYESHRREVREIQQQIDEMTASLRHKDRELEELKAQKTDDNQRLQRQRDAANTARRAVTFEDRRRSSGGPSIPDALIEDMFLEDCHESTLDTAAAAGDALASAQQRCRELEDETRHLHTKLREVSKRESGWERTLCDKDKQIAALNERIGEDQLNMTEISDSITARRDIEQLRELLDEKDRHIQDLTDTLTHFHDDQQKFINDTSIHSAEQVTQLGADLSRADATNRILSTQLEAVKRQLAAIGQREVQARECIKTLKTQLIRRPVISVKTTSSAERPQTTSTLMAMSRDEQLQKRLHQQDHELVQLRQELQKMSAAAQSRRNKDAAELALWNKQKRSQHLAETLRQKLVERDAELDKVKGHLASAKTAIARLEREKHILETRRQPGGGGAANKYCLSPSCPNVHVTPPTPTMPPAAASSKYTPAESPDSAFTAMLEYAQQQPPLSAESQPGSSRSRRTGVHLDISDGNQEVIDALRSRIETQQRRIVAMELEGRGGTAMGGELERLQERVSNVEAMNIRLEARNLQLQLDNDMLRQGDQGEKTRRQIKHLEDYILALKSELTQSQINCSAADAQRLSFGASAGPPTTSVSSQQQHMEQTILSLRRIVERLKCENKQLKDGRATAPAQSSTPSNSKAAAQTAVVKEIYEKMRCDLERVQQSYSESLDKISALQIELDIQRGICNQCKTLIEKQSAVSTSASNLDDGDDTSVGRYTQDDVASLKEKLIKKTQLLEKAKILLSRAAAKEKQFRDQIGFLKRRCAELQNVPVILEETSSD